MNTVLDADQRTMDIGNMVMHSMDSGVNFFTPEMIMEKLVKDYRSAKEILGETMIRQLTGYDADYVEKNVRIPEFERLLKERVKENIHGLRKEGLVDNEGGVTEEAIELATVVMAVQELDHLSAEGVIGERTHKRKSLSGTREEVKPFNNDPYRSINIAQSVKVAARRKHRKLLINDLRAFEREARGSVHVIYSIDASGSMKGDKLSQAKRAGIALAYKATERGDRVGLVVFGKEVKIAIPPCKDFQLLLRNVTRVRAGLGETDIAGCIRASVSLFPSKAEGKHLILLSDALPTVGKNPDADVLAATSEASAAGVSISVIGIALDKRGEALARRIADLADGRIMLVNNLGELDMIVLEEYLAVSD